MRGTALKFKDFELDPVSYQLLCQGSPVRLERIPMEFCSCSSHRAQANW